MSRQREIESKGKRISHGGDERRGLNVYFVVRQGSYVWK